MSDEREFVRQLNNMKNAKNETEHAKYRERVEAYAHCDFYKIYDGLVVDDQHEVLSGKERKERHEALIAEAEKPSKPAKNK